MRMLALLVLSFLAGIANAQPGVERAVQGTVALDIRLIGGGQKCAGFVYAPGRIMTAAHCTEGAVFFMVYYNDGTASRAKLIGQSINDDIAVLEIVDHAIKPLKMGRSNALKPGDLVFAIGHPHGNIWTVTAGVVSHTNVPARSYSAKFGTTVRMIQSSALSSHGSSGGPLINGHGEVVGVVVGGGNLPWAGYAIPITHALEVAKGLVNASNKTTMAIVR